MSTSCPGAAQKSKSARAEAAGYRPTAADALAFIEVSDTTYAVDRKYKIPLYVAAGVPSYIVNVPLRQVEYYGDPQDLEAEHGRVFAERDTFEILKVVIPISTLFSP